MSDPRNATSPLPLTPAELRAHARAVKLEAERQAETDRIAAYSANFEAAVTSVMDWAAGVDDPATGKPVPRAAGMLAAAKCTAHRVDISAKAQELLLDAKVTTDRRALCLTGPKEWARQNGRFVRAGAELEVGSYAIGTTHKKHKTIACYALAIVQGRQARYVLDVNTSAEKAGTEAARLFAEVWTAIEAEAARRELEEVNAMNGTPDGK